MIQLCVWYRIFFLFKAREIKNEIATRVLEIRSS